MVDTLTTYEIVIALATENGVDIIRLPLPWTTVTEEHVVTAETENRVAAETAVDSIPCSSSGKDVVAITTVKDPDPVSRAICQRAHVDGIGAADEADRVVAAEAGDTELLDRRGTVVQAPGTSNNACRAQARLVVDPQLLDRCCDVRKSEIGQVVGLVTDKRDNQGILRSAVDDLDADRVVVVLYRLNFAQQNRTVDLGGECRNQGCSVGKRAVDSEGSAAVVQRQREVVADIDRDGDRRRTNCVAGKPEEARSNIVEVLGGQRRGAAHAKGRDRNRVAAAEGLDRSCQGRRDGGIESGNNGIEVAVKHQIDRHVRTVIEDQGEISGGRYRRIQRRAQQHHFLGQRNVVVEVARLDQQNIRGIVIGHITFSGIAEMPVDVIAESAVLVAGIELHDIDAGAAVDGVVPVLAFGPVGVGAAPDLVIAAATE